MPRRFNKGLPSLFLCSLGKFESSPLNELNHQFQTHQQRITSDTTIVHGVFKLCSSLRSIRIIRLSLRLHDATNGSTTNDTNGPAATTGFFATNLRSLGTANLRSLAVIFTATPINFLIILPNPVPNNKKPPKIAGAKSVKNSIRLSTSSLLSGSANHSKNLYKNLPAIRATRPLTILSNKLLTGATTFLIL